MGYQPVDLGHPDANRAINGLLAELDDSAPQWWYLSFVDPAKTPPRDQQCPGGQSWLGACYVKATNEVTAAREAWAQGCNPGGAVALWGPFDDEAMAGVRPDQRNVLITDPDGT